MTSVATPPEHTAVPAAAFEVATRGCDTLRANVTVIGRLDDRTSALLAGVLRAHVAAGRRYLRVSVPDVDCAAAGATAVLVAAHRELAAVGGTLLVEDVPAQLLAQVRDAGVNARAAD